MAATITGYVMVAIFSIVLLAIGLYAAWGGRIADFDDYSVAGRNVGLGLGIGTLLASWVTASTIIAAPQIAYQLGYLGAIGYAMGGLGLVLFAPMAKRIRRMMPEGTTVTDFFLARYDRKNYYLFMVFFFTLIFMNSAQLPIAAGTLLDVIFDIPYHIGMLAATVPVLIYVLTGGLRASISTDYLQTIGIILLLLVFIPMVLLTVSPSQIANGMQAADPSTVSLTAPEGLLWALSAVFFLFGLILMLNSFWQRLFSFNEEQVTKAYVIAGISWAAIPLLTGIFGFVARARGIAVENINQVAPLVMTRLFPPVIVVSFAILVYLAFSSSLDTRINGMAVLSAHELYYKHFNPEASNERMLRAGRIATAVFGVVILAIGWTQPALIDIIVVLSPINAAYVPAFVLGVFWKKTSSDAVFAGTLLASLFGIYGTLGPFLGLWQPPNLPINTEYMTTMICFVLSTGIIVGGSLLFPETYDFDRLASVRSSAGGSADD
jgi:Na+/proline symporter